MCSLDWLMCPTLVQDWLENIKPIPRSGNHAEKPVFLSFLAMRITAQMRLTSNIHYLLDTHAPY